MPAASSGADRDAVSRVEAAPIMSVRGSVYPSLAATDWPALYADIDSCRACALGASRHCAVPGTGAQGARWLLVGEAPGAEEDRQGLPFVGNAGALLDSMLHAVGLNRERDVYITNVLKCRPPGNRNPEPEEVACCQPFLARQIALVRPSLIVLMGRFAAQALLGTEASIGSLRGRVHSLDLAGLKLSAVVTYHPAYLLRNLPDKAKAWQDWLLARRTMQAFGEGSEN